MKSILNLAEGYLRKFPAPAGIQMIQNFLLKLTYNFSSPFTDSKSSKNVFVSIGKIQSQLKLESFVKKLNYNEKGRIQQSQSFDSITVSQKHQKILQDDVFGKAKLSKDNNRWVYIAHVKQEKTKSYFNKGEGKKIYQYDFGQTYDDIKQARIFIWDKKMKQVFRIQTQKHLIPACPSFINNQGSKIIFHAYKKNQFGHGLLHCFNRDISIYEIQFQLQQKVQDQSKQSQITKAKIKSQKQRLKNLSPIIKDQRRTNIFPNISNCFNYLVYCSGQGKTHTHYLDLVVMKKNGQSWNQIHRLKDTLIGYYCTLKLFPSVNNQNKPICYFQTIDKALQKIYKLDLQSGNIKQFSKSQIGQSFAISQLLPNGVLLGTTTTNNFSTFFYSKKQQQQLKIIDPISKQKFIIEQIHEPIHAYYLEATQQDLAQQFKYRAKKRPIVLISHGGPHGAIQPTLTLLRYSLLKMGYSILMPNFSGSAGFGQQFLQNALQKIGSTDAKQIIKLLQKILQQKKYLDKDNVHIYGGSYGGFMGGIMGSRFAKYFKSAIILNGVLSIPANLFFTDIPEWNTVQTLGKQQLHNLTKEDYIQMFKQSPISEAMKIPTLQFLGAKDRRVPYRQGLLFDAMTKRNRTEITTYVYENSNHSLADSVQTNMDIIIKSLLFLQGKLNKVEETIKDGNVQNKQQKKQGQNMKIDETNQEQKIIS